MAYDNNAYIITSTYHGGSETLTIYITHRAPSKDSKTSTEYRIIQLNSFAIIGNPDYFRQEASALRNARNWVKEKREELIIAANGKVPDTEHSDLILFTQSFISLSLNEITHSESKTLTNELALNVDTFTSSSHKTSVRAQTNLPPKVSPNRQSIKASQVKKRPSRRPKASQVIYKEPRL